jgi:molybdenum cofactor biosynthesis protein B
MPGSRAAVELAMTKIIRPELPHLVREARKQ